jgi:hypothetical protein
VGGLWLVEGGVGGGRGGEGGDVCLFLVRTNLLSELAVLTPILFAQLRLALPKVEATHGISSRLWILPPSAGREILVMRPLRRLSYRVRGSSRPQCETLQS